MTRTTNARLAGFMFLFYIATAFPGMVLFDQATTGVGIAAKLASIAQHAPHMRLSIVFSVITILDAVILALVLYAVTRDEDPDLAVLALSCRVGEGVITAVPTLAMVGLLWLGTAGTAAALDAAAANALASLLLRVRDWSTTVGATVFAVGSTLYSYLFLRARSIPGPLAWLGVVASILLVVALPAHLAGFIRGAMGWLMWMPMLVFEVTLGLWLLVKGVRASDSMSPAVDQPSTFKEKKMRLAVLRALLICLLAPAAIATAQDHPPTATGASPENPLSANNRFMYRGVKWMLLRSAEKMPEEHYNFKPTEAVRSYGQILGHVADSQYLQCSSVLGEKNPAPKIEKTKTSKADLIAALKEVFTYCDKAYDSMTDASGAVMVKLHGGMPKLGVLNANNLHAVEHYGNLVVYMRMKDIVPPSSEPDFMQQMMK